MARETNYEVETEGEVMGTGVAYNEPAVIQELQIKHLAETLRYANANSLYYQRMFRDQGIDPASIQRLEDLKKLPFTNKEDLQKFNSDFLCVPMDKVIDVVRTSGTQGDPVTLMLTEKDLNRLAYNEANSFACAGIKHTDLIQLMTTIDRQFMAGMAYFLGARKLGAGIIRVGSANPEMQWDSIHRLKPTHVIAVPSFLVKMIEYAQRNGIDVNASSVQAALCIGEPIREQDFSPNSLTRRINTDWNIKLFSTYASTEMSTAFTECEAGLGGHLQPDLLIMEVLDAEGNTVPEGKVGELTITTIGVEAMPLIRFRTGDIVMAHRGPCPCGRNTPRLGPILGRKGQMIKYRGTTLYPPVIVNVLNTVSGIDGFIIELSTDELGMDRIKLLVSAQDGASELLSDAIKDRFRAKLRVVPEIELCDATTINALRFPRSGRKPILVLDKR